MNTYYRGRTALVTGASSGIGADMARQLGGAGARVILVARREEALTEVAQAIRQSGGEAVVIAADLEPADSAAELVDRLGDETVDFLVNNAGFGIQGPFLDADAESAEGMVGLNVTTLTSLTRRLLPGMVHRQRGGVLNVASVAAFIPAPQFAVYAATKAYVLSLSEALSQEMKGTGVHVTCLCPGPVKTEFADRAGMADAFFSGAMASDEVARQGLAGLAENRRRVVPGLSNKIQTAAVRFVPPGPLLAATEAIMRKAG